MNIQGHSVQFYQDDTFLTESVARFITEGLQANETAIMVAILWAEGQTRAALRLEELWNRLIEQQSFALLCAYPMANLSQEDNDSVLAISRLHTHVHNPADRSHISLNS